MVSKKTVYCSLAIFIIGFHFLITDVKQKKFKFTIVGDGFIYYFMSDMQCKYAPDLFCCFLFLFRDVNSHCLIRIFSIHLGEAKSNLALCNHTLSISEAYTKIETQKKMLQAKKRKVLISIGVTDLRFGKTLPEMRREFTELFLRCEEYGLKPLITTLLCYDSPELKGMADSFNAFLMDSFENVIDMRDVLKSGLAEVMTVMNEE